MPPELIADRARRHVLDSRRRASAFSKPVLEHVGGEVGLLHVVVGDAVLAVLALEEALDELVVGRVVERLEVRRGKEVPGAELVAHGARLDLARRQRGDRHLVDLEAFLLELLVEGDVGRADHRREDEVRLGLADLVEHRTELGAAERDVLLAEQFAAGLLQPDLGVLVRLLRPDIVGADEEDLLAEVLHHVRDRGPWSAGWRADRCRSCSACTPRPRSRSGSRADGSRCITVGRIALRLAEV